MIAVKHALRRDTGNDKDEEYSLDLLPPELISLILCNLSPLERQTASLASSRINRIGTRIRSHYKKVVIKGYPNIDYHLVEVELDDGTRSRKTFSMSTSTKIQIKETKNGDKSSEQTERHGRVSAVSGGTAAAAHLIKLLDRSSVDDLYLGFGGICGRILDCHFRAESITVPLEQHFQEIIDIARPKSINICLADATTVDVDWKRILDSGLHTLLSFYVSIDISMDDIIFSRLHHISLHSQSRGFEVGEIVRLIKAWTIDHSELLSFSLNYFGTISDDVVVQLPKVSPQPLKSPDHKDHPYLRNPNQSILIKTIAGRLGWLAWDYDLVTFSSLAS